MVMLGTFLPWNASTLDVKPVIFPEPSDVIGRCKFSCCRSLVVVIFVKSPATISMISVMGIPLISYLRLASFVVLRRPAWPREDRNSSFAKLWICWRSRTLMVLSSYLDKSSWDHEDLGTVEYEGGVVDGRATGSTEDGAGWVSSGLPDCELDAVDCD